MSGIYPNPSASATNFKPGDQVKWYVGAKESPYVGRVTEVCAGINKVWVEFPVGGNQQMDPTDLVMVTPFTGQSFVTENTGYSSYDKSVSQKDYGTMRQNLVKKAQAMLLKKAEQRDQEQNRSNMASRIAHKYATSVVDVLASDVLECIKSNLTDIETYQKLYPQYESMCSDGFMRNAIEKIYEHAGQ